MNNNFKTILKNKGFIGSSVVLVIAINLLNVVVAMSKDIAMASYLGTTSIADNFFIAFFIPDMLGNNLFAITCGVAAVPILAEIYIKKGEASFRQSLTDIAIFSIIGSVLVLSFTLLFSRNIIMLIGAGFGKSGLEACVNLLNIMAPTIVLFPMITLGVSVLQVRKKFGYSTFVTVIMNMILLLAIIMLSFSGTKSDSGVYLIAVAVTLSIILGILFLVFGILKTNQAKEINNHVEIYETKALGKISMSSQERRENLLKFWSGFWPYFLMLIVIQSVMYYERYLGSIIGNGSVSAINYAYRLTQFPILVFSVSIALVALPEISKAVSHNKVKEIGVIYTIALKNIVLITIPIAIGMVLLRVPIIMILFKHNTFDTNSVELTARVLLGYGIAIIGQGIVVLNIRVLVATGKRILPLTILLLAAIINMLLDNLFVSIYGILGIGIGAAIGSVLMSMPICLVLFSRYVVSYKKGIEYLLRIIIANIPSLIIAFIMSLLWEKVSNEGYLVQLIYGAVSGLLICIASYFGIKTLKLIK